eukprot:gene14640-20607_t
MPYSASQAPALILANGRVEGWWERVLAPVCAFAWKPVASNTGVEIPHLSGSLSMVVGSCVQWMAAFAIAVCQPRSNPPLLCAPPARRGGAMAFPIRAIVADAASAADGALSWHRPAALQRFLSACARVRDGEPPAGAVVTREWLLDIRSKGDMPCADVAQAAEWLHRTTDVSRADADRLWRATLRALLGVGDRAAVGDETLCFVGDLRASAVVAIVSKALLDPELSDAVSAMALAIRAAPETFLGHVGALRVPAPPPAAAAGNGGAGAAGGAAASPDAAGGGAAVGLAAAAELRGDADVLAAVARLAD